jgi:hypothetical protein
MHIADPFLDIPHDEAGAAFEDDLAVIARLAAGFGVEGRGVEDEFGRAGRERGREGAAGRDGDQLAFAGSGTIAGELRAATLAAHFEPDFIRGLITGREAGGAAGFALRLEGGFETGDIDFEAAVAIYMNRRLYMKYLKYVIDTAKEPANILELNLFTVLGSVEGMAAVRARRSIWVTCAASTRWSSAMA